MCAPELPGKRPAGIVGLEILNGAPDPRDEAAALRRVTSEMHGK